MQPYEPQESCGEAKECIITQKRAKNMDYNRVLRKYQLNTLKHL